MQKGEGGWYTVEAGSEEVALMEFFKNEGIDEAYQEDFRAQEVTA